MRMTSTSPNAASFATPYGERGRIAVRSVCGDSFAAPKTSPEFATSTRMPLPASCAAFSSVPVAPATSAIVCAGSFHDAGTNVGAARW